MPAKLYQRIVLTFTVGLTITAAGVLLTWYQVGETELNRAASDAREVVSATEHLLDETRTAIDRARPLLTKSCTSEASAQLNRLTIGMEHIRVINFFHQNLLACSSFGGADPVREFISADDNQTLLLATDDYISPGEPVMILRRLYGDRSITASVATRCNVSDMQKSLAGVTGSFTNVYWQVFLPQSNVTIAASPCKNLS
ncbi:TPA: CSS-motif domain-containing protein [Klebsiella oxytoca]|nr:CSS-motif domain-containing protein [Klebsiella oxytoca]